MASISTDKNGNRTIQYYDGEKVRRSIRLGKLAMKTAESIKCKIESLIGAKTAGFPMDVETAKWIATIDSRLADKLTAVGLIPARGSADLGSFLVSYVSTRSDVKASTKLVLGHTQRCLVGYFGENKPLREINAGEADEWRIWLSKDQHLAEATIRRRCSIAKQFMRAAIKRRLLAENPFSELRSGSQVNDAKDHFITVEDSKRILAACPNLQWKLVFALSRFGGLRCPSEHLALRWGDIDWERNRMLVHSPKTEHHDGGACRQVPLFPELRSILQEAFETAPEYDPKSPESAFVITLRRNTTTNLRTYFPRIIKRAGLKPWPKLFANLRASCSTELVARFPGHVVAAWLGHSMKIAQKHYWQVTDDDFLRATATNESDQKSAANSGAINGPEALQMPVPSATASNCQQDRLIQKVHSRKNLGHLPTTAVTTTHKLKLGDAGLEPATCTL
jgi:integrase